MNVDLANPDPSGKPCMSTRVTISPSDWIKIGLFVFAQTIALVAVGLDMRTRLAVLEERLTEREDNLRELKADINDLRRAIDQARHSNPPKHTFDEDQIMPTTTPAGLLSVPKQKLAQVLAQSATLQTWFGDGYAQKLFYSFLRVSEEEMPAIRPFAVLDWERFTLGQIAGGARNLLWPKQPTLRVILTDNDPYQHERPNSLASDAELIDGDIIAENLVGGVLADLANLAAVDDWLSTAQIELDMPPTRNPPKDWAAAGPYWWASFTVQYN